MFIIVYGRLKLSKVLLMKFRKIVFVIGWRAYIKKLSPQILLFIFSLKSMNRIINSGINEYKDSFKILSPNKVFNTNAGIIIVSTSFFLILLVIAYPAYEPKI